MTETVTLALSELRSLITKSARGAGLSWGMAEEAGWAAEWLARRGMPAADWATIWLASRMNGESSVVEVGAALADAYASTSPLSDTALPDGMAAPGYLLPFMHRIARAGAPVVITSRLGPVAQVSTAGDVIFGPLWQHHSHSWRLTAASKAGTQPNVSGRPKVSNSVLDCLDGLALRTTVPQSETSRRDAGSSGGDND